MRVKKIGVPFLEMMQDEKGEESPYKIWMSDHWECKCGLGVLSIHPLQKPIAEHFQADFADKLKKYNLADF